MSGAEEAEVVAATERRIVDRRFVPLSTEADQQRWIGVELLRSTVQLPLLAQIHQAAIVHAVDCAAQFNVLTAKCIQVADVACVLGQARDGKSAVGVAGLGAAGIEKTGAVAELGDVVDVSRDADVFAGVASSFGCRMAGGSVKRH